MTFHFRHFITQQDGRMKRTAKPDREITCVFYRNLHFTPTFSGPLQKDLFQGKWSLSKSCLKQNYCHPCHTRFAVFFPLPSCCVSSLFLDQNEAQRSNKIFFETGPPLSQGLDDWRPPLLSKGLDPPLFSLLFWCKKVYEKLLIQTCKFTPDSFKIDNF